MVGNPYRLADSLGSRRSALGAASMVGRLAPIIAACIALPFLRDNLLSFAALSGAARSAGAVGAMVRVALLLAAVLALRAYDLVVRGPDRGVVDLHPVRAAPYVRARLWRALREGAPASAAAAVVLVPVWPDLPAFCGGIALLLGAWAAGVGVGVGVNLAAPALGADPRFADALDVVRGQNPRTQAALVWAPAVTLAGVGLSLVGAAGGLDAGLRGNPWGFVALAIPFGAAGIGARLAFVSADTLARIPAVLGEVDAAYSAVEDAEEGQRVYLEWIVPRLPPVLRPETLRVLRHGWRAERTWLSASFLAALVAAAAGWSANPEAAARLVAVGGLAAVGLGLLASRLRAQDPSWLNLSFPAPNRRLASAIATFAWIQPVILVGSAVLLVRQGGVAAGAWLRLEAVALAMAALGATLPVSGYVPAALLVWAVGVWA